MLPESQPCAAPQVVKVPSLQAVVVWDALPTQFQVTVSPVLMLVRQTLPEKVELQNQKSPTFTLALAAVVCPVPATPTPVSLTAIPAIVTLRRRLGPMVLRIGLIPKERVHKSW